MGRLYEWLARIRGAASARRLDAALDEELDAHREMLAAEYIRRGMRPDHARRAARLRLGGADQIKEAVRDTRGLPWLGSAVQDLRYGARLFRRRPAFTAAAVVMLAVGIGASTAIFSAAYTVLFEPLPYPHGSRIVLLSDYGTGGERVDVTFGTYRELAERSRSFAALAATDRWQPALMGLAEPERLVGGLVTARYFRVLGVGPAVGRDFVAADDRPGAPRVAILSDGLVRRRFGGDPSIVGQRITLDGDPYTVIGVMPASFDNVLSPSADVWAPRRFRADAPFESAEWGHHMKMLGRLAPGVSLDQARREIAAIGETPAAGFPRPPWASMKGGLVVEPLQAAVTLGVRPALMAVLAAVALVLAIAAANVTGLLLARGAQRQGELALRAVLGAGRGRLVRQLLTESLVLALVGGGLGLGIAAWGVHALVALAPADLPRAGAIGLDAPAFVFAATLSTLVGLAAGLVPALQGARRDLRAPAGSGARATGAAHHALRRSLVAAEIALALIVLAGAGLMLRSLARLLATAPGFDAAHLLTMQVEAAGHRYDSDTARLQFFEQALDAVRHVPGVVEAAFTSQLPLSGDLDAYGVELESAPRNAKDDYANALRFAVSPDWFRAMRIPLIRGRLLDAHDRPGEPEAIVISESFARRAFPGVDPIGQRLRAGPEIGDRKRPWDVIVGVVGDIKQTSLALGADDAFYVATGQWAWVDRVQSLVVRTTGAPSAFVPAVERAIWSVDRDQPIVRVATMGELVARSEARRRFVLIVFEAFGLSALALAAIGVFGTLAGSVTERLHELGVRAALGASRASLIMLVIGQGLTLAAAGIAAGLCGAALLSGTLRTLLFGISRADAPTYLGAAAVVLIVAIAASAIPAWRAANVDPAATLRA